MGSAAARYHNSPVVIVGAMPKRSDTEARAVLASVSKKQTEVAKPLDEIPRNKNPSCKCTGGPSNAIEFGEGNVQYPADYGKTCFDWSPRDVTESALFK